ncbi:MAG: TIGR00269 family protein [Candidatus Woesearchaeota archaeon]
MECRECGGPAVFDSPALCEEHFLSYVVDTVKATIVERGLIRPGERVCVAASGGKDSVALLDVLSRLGYEVEALAVDEGIEGYRDASLDGLRSFCGSRGIPLRVVSFAEEVGKPLDSMVGGRHPCSVCGVFRRYLLNRYARGYDVLATGHNLDDEAQAVLMNLLKGNAGLLDRTSLRSPPAEGFVPRVKPLAFLPERALRAYTLLRGVDVVYDECPYAPQSLRVGVRDVLNRHESENPGMKRSLVEAGLRGASHTNGDYISCPRCGEPSSGGVCRACALRESIVGGS